MYNPSFYNYLYNWLTAPSYLYEPRRIYNGTDYMILKNSINLPFIC